MTFKHVPKISLIGPLYIMETIIIIIIATTFLTCANHIIISMLLLPKKYDPETYHKEDYKAIAILNIILILCIVSLSVHSFKLFFTLLFLISLWFFYLKNTIKEDNYEKWLEWSWNVNDYVIILLRPILLISIILYIIFYIIKMIV